MRTYTPEELDRIAMQIAKQPGLYLPLSNGAPSVPRTSGPTVCVYLKYSELVRGAESIENLYWKKLRQTPVIPGVGVLATIGCILSEHRSADKEIHQVLQERFLTPDIVKMVAEKSVGGPGFTGVFTRIGCLQLMRHLLVYGNRKVKPDSRSIEALGELVLLTNEFLQVDEALNPTARSTLDLLLLCLPVWDIHNPRDMAYAISRIFQILTEILRGSDLVVRQLTRKLGMNTSDIKIGTLQLEDFVAAVFGLFAYGRKLKGSELAIFDVRRIFAKVGFSRRILRKLVNDRALTPSAFRRLFSDGKPFTFNAFRDELGRRSFLMESLNIIRQRPLMKMDSNRVLILDLDFIAELLTAGVYWSIFDGLPPNMRETFRELWGRLFELYTVDLLKQFYPALSGILAADLPYDGGQVDALLDFGPVVVVLEIKSSLLTETAKRSGSREAFIADYDRKFVRNTRGKSKALLQLATSCIAIEEGRIQTAIKPTKVFPVCISDEPAVESLFFTTYSNERFQQATSGRTSIQPLTMMTVNELEEMLPYVADNAFSWSELLEFRYRNFGGAFSVHQAIFDLLREKNLPRSRNQAVRKSFEEVRKSINARYKPLKSV